MTVRYANDLVLTDLARQIHNTQQSLQSHLTDGYLDGAFLRALELTTKLEKLQERLNDIKYGRVP